MLLSMSSQRVRLKVLRAIQSGNGSQTQSFFYVLIENTIFADTQF